MKSIDVGTGSTVENIIELRRMMDSLEVGETLEVTGKVPVVRIGSAVDNKTVLSGIDYAVISDLASIYRLKIVDYKLPQHTQGNIFQLYYEKDESGILEKPERVAVMSVSSACIANCVMCGIPQLYAGRAVSTSEILNALVELKLCGFTSVDLFGGEITLRDDLFDLIRAAKKLNLFVMIISTGYKIDAPYLNMLIDSGLDKITISLDAATAEKHDYIKGREGVFKDAVNALKVCKDNPYIYSEVNTVVIEENIDDLVPLHHFVVDKLGVWCHRLFYYTHTPDTLIQPKWMSKDSARHYFEDVYPELLAINKKYKATIDFCPNINPDQYQDKSELYENVSRGIYHRAGKCVAPETDLMMIPDGKLYPCVSPTIANRKPELGTIGRTKLVDALKGNVLKQWLKQAGSWDECKDCISRK